MNELYLNKLQKNKFKLTPKRIAIIDLFLNKNRYLTPEAAWKILKKKFDYLGLPTIYRNLETFSKCGILVKIQRPNRKLYYGLCESQGHKYHHHIICIKCGRIGEFFKCDLSKKKVINGFKVLNHSLQFEGICSECR